MSRARLYLDDFQPKQLHDVNLLEQDLKASKPLLVDVERTLPFKNYSLSSIRQL